MFGWAYGVVMNLRLPAAVKNKETVKKAIGRPGSLLFKTLDVIGPVFAVGQERKDRNAAADYATQIVSDCLKALSEDLEGYRLERPIDRLSKMVGAQATARMVGGQIDHQLKGLGITEVAFDGVETAKLSQIRYISGYGNPGYRIFDPTGPTIVVSRAAAERLKPLEQMSELNLMEYVAVADPISVEAELPRAA